MRALVVCVGILGGCTPSEKPAAPVTHSCTLTIRLNTTIQTVRAQAEDADPKVAEASAYERACAQLPMRHRPNCRNKDHFTPQIRITQSGGLSQAVLTLSQARPTATADGSSDQTEEAACQVAIEAACQRLESGPDCVKSRRYSVMKREALQR